MDNISSTYEDTMLITYIPLWANNIKDDFDRLGDYLGDLPNQIRKTVASDIILHLYVWVWTRVGTTTNIIPPL